MSDAAGVLVLIGRVLFAYFFVVAGIGHFKKDQLMKGYAAKAGFPIPAVAGWVAGLWLIVAAVSVAFGIWPDLGSLMVGVFVIPATVFFHRFWLFEDDVQKMTQKQAFDRNLLIFGTSLAFLGTFVTLGSELRFTITGPLFNF